MFFRRGSRDDRWLEIKIILFGAGSLLAVVGMSLGNDWVVGAAGLLLAAGIVLRVVPAGDDGTDDAARQRRDGPGEPPPS